MAYRVEYGSIRPSKPQSGTGWGTAALTLITLSLFLSGVKHFWAEGAYVLEKLLSPERFLEAGRALDTLAQQLQTGQPLWDTITAFCADVVQRGMEYAA